MGQIVEKLFFETLARTAPRDMGNRTIALCYHRIVPRGSDPGKIDRFTVYAEDFDAQISSIKEAGFEIINPDRIESFAGKGVVISFDDDIPTHVTEALPILQKHDCTATFFLNPEELGQPERMEESDVETLIDAGMIVGAHHTVDVLFLPTWPH